MNTGTFFSKALPSRGQLCVAALHASGVFVPSFYDTAAHAASAALSLDARGTGNVYMGCASFKDDTSRKQKNVAFVRSLWLDIDCGPEKPYAAQADAARALVSFNRTIALPPPLVVSSGYGLHVYWPMDRDMLPDEWLPMATLLKQATIKFGLHVDQSRTTDSASVLRPPGTHNRKDPTNPKLVEIK